mmetsp:Transcript_118043/g.333881  ORF Transcript_118043/g.333881 Transcript_118043/m.333881 type:complete len:289 (-) Transcript_118043:115-981(-)
MSLSRRLFAVRKASKRSRCCKRQFFCAALSRSAISPSCSYISSSSARRPSWLCCSVSSSDCIACFASSCSRAYAAARSAVARSSSRCAAAAAALSSWPMASLARPSTSNSWARTCAENPSTVCSTRWNLACAEAVSRRRCSSARATRSSSRCWQHPMPAMAFLSDSSSTQAASKYSSSSPTSERLRATRSSSFCSSSCTLKMDLRRPALSCSCTRRRSNSSWSSALAFANRAWAAAHARFTFGSCAAAWSRCAQAFEASARIAWSLAAASCNAGVSTVILHSSWLACS